MHFLDLAARRYSVRKFDGRPLTQADCDAILQAALLAPTAKNIQPQRILVLKSEEAIEKLKACTPFDFGAKTAFLVCVNTQESWKRDPDGADSALIDGAIVATHMMLAAAAAGAGTTCVMRFDLAATKKHFDLPENILPVCFLPAGYPAADAVPGPLHEKCRPARELITVL